VYKYFILSACVAILVVAVTLQKNQFLYVRKAADAAIEVKDKDATILFVGDIMLGRNVENLMNQYGKEYPFEHVQPLLSSTEKVVANLEGPIMDPHVHTASGGMHFSFSSTTVENLVANNISLVTLANNHTGDFGNAGYFQTAAFLDQAHVDHVGHPYLLDEAYTKHVVVDDQHILYIAFNFTNPQFNITTALKFVKNAQREPGEFIVALVHGGTEYALHSDSRQETFYRGLIDGGVDLVIAHHPHVVEEIELYKNKPIFYSLGNFIFDQYFSNDVQEGIVVELHLNDSQATYKLIPLKSVNSQPEVMKETEKYAWLKKLAEQSSENIQNDIAHAEFKVRR
jgi:poly-gamma-glutamate synthesis protein (capsule biosynthesis protein)